MKVLFITLLKISSIDESNIYMDLMRCFAERGEEVFIISPLEKKEGGKSTLEKGNGISLLRVRTGDLFNVSLLKKALGQFTLPYYYKRGINSFFKNIDFDLIIYTTPPISIFQVVRELKNKYGAKTYLLLKDIFPQNAKDLGLIREPFFSLFRKTERKLYDISDYIGCMSEKNVEYLIENNKIDAKKIEVCPNSIHVRREYRPKRLSGVLKKYEIPEDRLIFIYGGNLSIPQDVGFIVSCIERAGREFERGYFVICGDGSKRQLLEDFIRDKAPKNLSFLGRLNREEYEEIVAACDVGLIFLDNRFTIPNFPSRLLSYMENSKPVLVCTDENTDIGSVVTKNNFGLYTKSDNTENFVKKLREFDNEALREDYGLASYRYLVNNYRVELCYDIIMKHFTAIKLT